MTSKQCRKVPIDTPVEGFPGCKTLREVADKYKQPHHRMRQRYARGERGKALIAPPLQGRRQDVILGRTYKQWAVWFACQGVDVSWKHIRYTYIYHRSTAGRSPDEAMEKVKQKFLTKNQTHNG